MIETVQIRQKGSYDFYSYYEYMCCLQNTIPVATIKAQVAQGVLELNADRIRAADWEPLMKSLKINKSIHTLTIRSIYQYPLSSEDLGVERIKSLRKKAPPIRSRELTFRLCRALKEVLTISPSLKELTLKNLILRERDLVLIAKGLSRNAKLEFLSLDYCPIGDEGVDLVCRGLRTAQSVQTLTFSGCNLTSAGAEKLAGIIKHQAMRRHNEAWKDSLRYRRPDLDKMPGIRRITVNHNPMIGDEGAHFFAEALKDDLWLKALDMQGCGISTDGAKCLLEVLKYNTMIVVLDVRKNPLIDRDLLNQLMEQLTINGCDEEYQWIKPQSPVKSTASLPPAARRSRTKTASGSVTKRASMRVTAHKRSKSTGSVIRSRSASTGRVPGIPWRAAARANRIKGYAPELELELGAHQSFGSNLFDDENTCDENDPDYGPCYSDQEDSDPEMNRNGISSELRRHYELDIERWRRKYEIEFDQKSKIQCETTELTIENAKLRRRIAELEQQRQFSVLDDESFIQSIEQSYLKIGQFLDLLRQVGFEQLLSEMGIRAEDFRLPGNSMSMHRSTSGVDTTLQASMATNLQTTNDGDPTMSSFGGGTSTDDERYRDVMRRAQAVLQQSNLIADSDPHLAKDFASLNISSVLGHSSLNGGDSSLFIQTTNTRFPKTSTTSSLPRVREAKMEYTSVASELDSDLLKSRDSSPGSSSTDTQ